MPSISFKACYMQILALISKMGCDLPNIILLLYAALVICCQTEIVERGFSFHRIFKGRLSNRLKSFTLDSLMRIKLNCPNPPKSLSSPHPYLNFPPQLRDEALDIITRQGSMRQAKAPLLLAKLH
jgi:hypothetical protein